MTRRVNETVYRVRWMRKKWAGPRSDIFLSRHSAERRLEKLRNAWKGAEGTNPLLWTSLEHARVTWEGGDMDHRPYAYHPPVKKRKGLMANLRAKSSCAKCRTGITEVEPGTWSAGGFTVCPGGGWHEPV